MYVKMDKIHESSIRQAIVTDKSKQDFWKMQSELDIQGLINALSSEDKLFRRRAVVALRGMNAINAIPALQKAHQEEEDPETSMIIATAIEMLKDSPGGAAGYNADTPQVSLVQRLITQVKSGNPEQVANAAHKLGEMGEKIAVEPLILEFSKSSHTIHVRLAIAEALLKLESAPVEVALLANLRHSDWHIRRNGAAILGQLQAEWAIGPLSKSLKDPHPVVRRTALAALKHIGTPESRRALAQFSPSQTQATSGTQATPQKVSGIQVKRPGKQAEDNDESPLLKRLRQKREAEKQGLVTKPLDPTKIEATQPIPGNMLDQLDAFLDDDDEPK